MADQLMTSGGELTAIVPEVWSGAFFNTLKASLPFVDSISRDYEGEIRNLGDTVNISQLPEFSEGSELAEGAAADAEAVTVDTYQLVINKRIVKDFMVTRKGQLQSIEIMDKLRDHAAYSIMKKMQSIIIAAINPSSSLPDHQIAFDSGTTLALADILEAKELLDEQNVSEAGRIGVLDVPQANDLFNISGFTSRDFIPAGSPLTEGAINTPVLGFQMKMTNALSNVSYFFHPSMIQLAVQQNLDVRVYDKGSEGLRADRVNTDLLFGLKSMDEGSNGNLRVVKIG
jgi:hypothetical protein